MYSMNAPILCHLWISIACALVVPAHGKKTGLDVYYDDMFDKFRFECCGNEHKLATLEDAKGDVSWKSYAAEVCAIMDEWEKNGTPLRPLILFAFDNVSKNLCRSIHSDNNALEGSQEEIEWLPIHLFTREFDDYASKEEIMERYNIGTLCKMDKIQMKMLIQDFENVYNSVLVNFKDCIEGEWNEWEPPDEVCREGNGRIYRKRKRSILYQGAPGGRECKTEEREDCTDELPLCSEHCLLTEWTPWSACKDGKRVRNRYIRVYSKSCENVEMEQTEDCADDSVVLLDATMDGKPIDQIMENGMDVMYDEMLADGSIESKEEDQNGTMAVPRYPSEENRKFCIAEFERMKEMCRGREYGSCFAKLKMQSVHALAFFTRCKLEDSLEGQMHTLIPLYRNKCFVTRALYSNGSWVDEKHSCKCSIPQTEPCSLDDVHALMMDQDSDGASNGLHGILGPGFCPTVNYKGMELEYPGEGLVDEKASIVYTALSGNKRLHCPLNKRFQVTDISDSDLSFFCQNGSIWMDQRRQWASLHGSMGIENVPDWSYDCRDVVAKGKMFKREECASACTRIETLCSEYVEDLRTCMQKRLTSDGHEGEEFKRYKCTLPEGDESDYCNGVYFETVKNKNECLFLCRMAREICEYEGVVSAKNSWNKCMAALFNDEYAQKFPNYLPVLQPDEKNDLERFKKECEFTKEWYTGKGFVLCKFKPRKEKYTEWSEWSPCTHHCMLPDYIPTRSRTRQVLGQQDGARTEHYSGAPSLIKSQKGTHDEYSLGGTGDQNDHSGDKSKPLEEPEESETLETALCLHLPICEESLEGDKILVIPEFKELQNDGPLMPEWISTAYKQYPELREPPRTNIKCEIVKTARIASLEHVKCGCPKNYRSCTFSMATGNPRFLERLRQICEQNSLAQVIFEKTERYVYYCNIGMVILQPEDQLLCDYPDSNEYICCYSYRKSRFKVTPWHFLGLGIGMGILIVLYLLYKRRIRRHAKWT